VKALWRKKDNLKSSDRPKTVAGGGIETLFLRNATGLWRFFLHRSGSESNAEDLMQELCLQLARTELPAGDDDFQDAWLFGVARNVWRNFIRGMLRRRNNIPMATAFDGMELVERVERGDRPEDILADDEKRQKLMTAVTSLAGIDQEIIRLHYFEGFSQSEVAAAVGISERAVEGRLYRARQTLRAKLADNDL